MIKDLLVPIVGSDADEPAVSAGIAIANAYEAHFVGAVLEPFLSAAHTPWGITSPRLVEALLEEQARTTRSHVARLRDRMLQRVQSWDVHTVTSRLETPAAAIAMQARHTDLSLMCAPRSGEADDVEAQLFHALLFESGRPVLIVPEGRETTAPFRNILVAWKSTKEAARAVHDAMTLFAPDAVQILVVDHPDEGGEEPGASTAAHLARHGPKVAFAARKSGTMSIATTVLLHAAEHGADLVVAGGYGHSRLREWVLGGTTRELLRHLEVPVLLSH